MKILSKKNTFWGLICCLALIAACNRGVISATSETAFIAPLIPGLEPAFTTFRADTEVDNQFDLPNGGYLKVPAGSFVDANGLPIKGTVDLKYREMHDAYDIMLAGISMAYDSAGSHHLETAGMFELRGSHHGQEIFIKEGSALEVRFASQVPENDYMAYYLDEKERNWKFLGFSSAAKPEKAPEKAKEPVGETPKQLFVLDYSAALDVEYNNTLNEYVNLNLNWGTTVLDTIEKTLDHDAVLSKIGAYDLKWMNAICYDKIRYDNQDVPAAFMAWARTDNKPLPKWLKPRKVPKGTTSPNGDQKGFEVKQPGLSFAEARPTKQIGIFSITFFNAEKTDSFQIQAEAVLPIGALFSVNPVDWKRNQVNMLAAKREKEKQELAAAFHNFRLLDFGVYNCDRLYKMGPTVLVNCQFQLDRPSDFSNTSRLYMIPEGDRSVIDLYTGIRSLKCPIQHACRFLAVLPDNKLAVFSVQQYKAIDFAGLQQATQPECTFQLSVLPQQIKSKDDLVAAISGN
jgi:hypothetical protein